MFYCNYMARFCNIGRFFVDGEHKLTVDPGSNFYDYGGFAGRGVENPWAGRDKMAPFDRPVSVLILYSILLNFYINAEELLSPFTVSWVFVNLVQMFIYL